MSLDEELVAETGDFNDAGLAADFFCACPEGFFPADLASSSEAVTSGSIGLTPEVTADRVVRLFAAASAAVLLRELTMPSQGVLFLYGMNGGGQLPHLWTATKMNFEVVLRVTQAFGYLQQEFLRNNKSRGRRLFKWFLPSFGFCVSNSGFNLLSCILLLCSNHINSRPRLCILPPNTLTTILMFPCLSGFRHSKNSSINLCSNLDTGSSPTRVSSEPLFHSVQGSGLVLA